MGGEFAAPSLKENEFDEEEIESWSMGGEFAAPSLKAGSDSRFV